MSYILTSETVALFAVLVSLIAVVVGSIVTFNVAKRQIVSPIRQKWIDELRELMSQYLSESRRALIMGEGEGILDTDKTDEELFRKLLYLEQKLELMLNSKERDHIDLIATVREITDEVHHGFGNIMKFGAKLESASKQCQKILKSEWVRVKSGAM
jgi:hypothetical protein